MIYNYMTCHYKYFLLNTCISWIGGAALSSVNRCIYLYTVLLGPDLILCHHKHCLIAISISKKISIVHGSLYIDNNYWLLTNR